MSGVPDLGVDPGSVSTNQAKEKVKQEVNSSGRKSKDSMEPSLHPSIEFSGDNKYKQEAIDHSEEAKQLVGIEERLHNLESHLRIVPGTPVPQDVYARLKAVEDRESICWLTLVSHEPQQQQTSPSHPPHHAAQKGVFSEVRVYRDSEAMSHRGKVGTSGFLIWFVVTVINSPAPSLPRPRAVSTSAMLILTPFHRRPGPAVPDDVPNLKHNTLKHNTLKHTTH
ncbi:MAP3K12-binding inhibitory protein 1 [Chionoecetes opilio]|uniref:MAP3K12-binding inhibitory protein 1 n=1 Tax=Chionoecetes opilio TaxID=41210 RepID=A0A8J4XZS1_CHIOP|nr:MAP3K12-binding inhibitory protein 1 [Chionoecetes opilio]